MRKRGKNITIDWNDEELVSGIGNIVDGLTEKHAEIVKERAIRTLQGAQDETGNLAAQVDVVVSKFKHGGHAVVAQGPQNWHKPYYASFLELGHKIKRSKKGAPVGIAKPFPYLRPALKRQKRAFYADITAAMKKI